MVGANLPEARERRAGGGGGSWRQGGSAEKAGGGCGGRRGSSHRDSGNGGRDKRLGSIRKKKKEEQEQLLRRHHSRRLACVCTPCLSCPSISFFSSLSRCARLCLERVSASNRKIYVLQHASPAVSRRRPMGLHFNAESLLVSRRCLQASTQAHVVRQAAKRSTKRLACLYALVVVRIGAGGVCLSNQCSFHLHVQTRKQTHSQDFALSYYCNSIDPLDYCAPPRV